MHTRPIGGNGSSCTDLPGSMPGGNVRAPGSSTQPGRSSLDGNQRTTSS